MPTKRTTRRVIADSSESAMAVDADGDVHSSSGHPLPSTIYLLSEFPLTNSTFIEPNVSLGALYDPRHLPDYGGPVFALKHAKLVQHDVVDNNDVLIPPWEMYSACRPGSLLIANVTLHCWKIDNIKHKVRSHLT
jgi:hypothetical protein